MFVRLLIFATLLAPAWVCMMRYYFFDPFIMRNIPYGQGAKKRNLLDVYLPFTAKSYKPGAEKRLKKPEGPVIVFLCGGAWIIGYKMWSCFLARELARFGYIVVVPDYRNFPQGNIDDMMADTLAAISWTKSHITLFGGDPNKIVLSGQSAGAHISLCTLVELYKASPYYKSSVGSPHLSPSSAATPRTNPVTTTTAGAGNGDDRSVDSLDELAVVPSDRCDEDNQTPSSPTGDHSPTVLFGTQFALRSPTSANRPSDVNDLHPTATTTTLDGSPAWTSTTSLDEGSTSVTIDDIKLFVGISGPYNLRALETHLHYRGLDSSILEWICKGDVTRYSPTHAIAKMCGKEVLMCQCICQCICMHPEPIAEEHNRGLFNGNNSNSNHVTSVNCSHDIPTAVARPLSMSEELSSATDGAVVVIAASDSKDSRTSIGSPRTSSSSSSSPGATSGGYDAIQPALRGFPKLALFHGCEDMSIPASVSSQLADVASNAAEAPTVRLYEELSHTDPILEALFGGDYRFLHDVGRAIHRRFRSHRHGHSSSESYKEDGMQGVDAGLSRSCSHDSQDSKHPFASPHHGSNEEPIVTIVKKLGAYDDKPPLFPARQPTVAGRNRQFASSLPFVYTTSHTSPSANDDAPLVNPVMCKLAKFVNPF